MKSLMGRFLENYLTYIVFSFVVAVFASYFVVFNDHISDNVQVWAAFGNYVGGILSPIIAGFAFYLIVKTYNLQRDELEKTRELLKISTDAQKDQIKLAALTALFDSNSSRIDMLKAEKNSLSLGTVSEPDQPKTHEGFIAKGVRDLADSRKTAIDLDAEREIYRKKRLEQIENEIAELITINESLEKRVQKYCDEDSE